VGTVHALRANLGTGVTASGWRFEGVATAAETAGVTLTVESIIRPVSTATRLRVLMVSVVGLDSDICRTGWPSYGRNKSDFS